MAGTSSNWPRVWAGLVEKLRLGSVLDNITAVIVALFLLIVVALFIVPTGWLILGLFVLVCVVVAVFIAAFIYFALTDPDKLRPSEHEIRKMEIAAGLGEKDKPLLSEAKLDELPAETAVEAKLLNPPKKKDKK